MLWTYIDMYMIKIIWIHTCCYSFVPFIRYQHPARTGGRQQASLSDYPQILWLENPEHIKTIIVGCTGGSKLWGYCQGCSTDSWSLMWSASAQPSLLARRASSGSRLWGCCPRCSTGSRKCLKLLKGKRTDPVLLGVIVAAAAAATRAATAAAARTIYTSIHPYIYTSIHPYMHTSIHLYIHASTHLYIHTSIHLYIHTSIHP